MAIQYILECFHRQRIIKGRKCTRFPRRVRGGEIVKLWSNYSAALYSYPGRLGVVVGGGERGGRSGSQTDARIHIPPSSNMTFAYYLKRTLK